MIEKDEEEEGIIFPPPEIKGKPNGVKESFASSSSSTTFYFLMETDWSIYSNEQNKNKLMTKLMTKLMVKSSHLFLNYLKLPVTKRPNLLLKMVWPLKRESVIKNFIILNFAF
jgi:hypothetical protein